MKRFISVICILSLLILLVSCNKDSNTEDIKTGKILLTIRSETTTTTKVSSSSITASSKADALRDVKDYLAVDFLGLSYIQLVSHLMEDGYSYGDAYWAISQCNIDFYKQAVSQAKFIATLDNLGISYSAAVQLLEEESFFTHEQAVYGVDNCEADWNEQAYKCAKYAITVDTYSYTGLVAALEDCEFTHDQAEYGASKALPNA